MDLARLQSAAAAVLLRLPEPAVSLLAGRRVVVDGVSLEVRTQLFLRLLARAGYSELVVPSVEVSRKLFARNPGPLGPPWRKLSQVTDRELVGPGAPLPVRIYEPEPSEPDRSPALVYYHGGGWVIGSIKTHDRLCRLLAHEARCTVVSVDYRLAPEHRFPAAVEDAQAAYRWVIGAADSLGIDHTRVAVGGDSAGGNLAAVVCQQAAASGNLASSS